MMQEIASFDSKGPSITYPGPMDEQRPKLGRRIRAVAGRPSRAIARALGHDLVKRNFYSAVPHLEALPPGFFDRAGDLRGVNLDVDAQLAELAELSTYLTEFEPGPGFFDNSMYRPFETELLYATIRRSRPRRVIELGSGITTLVIAAACRRNAADGDPVSYLACDPYPRDFVRGGADGLDELRVLPATAIPAEEFQRLGQGDVLFVDTTHTVKQGSEVNHLILDVLPALASGVLVQFHDIYLPYEYPLAYMEEGLYFGEQYLLQAFLAFNGEYEVLYATHALARNRPKELSRLIPSWNSEEWPSAFWIRRK